MAFPFRDIDRQDIPIDRLTNADGQVCDEVVLIVDLKNVISADDRGRQGSESDVPTISLEVISDATITKTLNECAAFGLLSPYQESNLHVRGLSLVHLWAGQCPDCRYWLCKRSSGAGLIVERCLNQAELLECFGDIQDEGNGTCSAITLFKEKRGETPFATITCHTIIVFYKIYEPENYNDLTYGGHLFVEGTMPCSDLLRAITDSIDTLDGDAYDLYLETENLCIQDITFQEKSLQECGVRSGSCVIARSRVNDRAPPLESVQRALSRIHEENESFKTSDGSSSASGFQVYSQRPRGLADVSVAAHTDGQMHSQIESSLVDDIFSAAGKQPPSEEPFDFRYPVMIGLLLLGFGSPPIATLLMKQQNEQPSKKARLPFWVLRRCLFLRRIRWKHFSRVLETRPVERYRPSNSGLVRK